MDNGSFGNNGCPDCERLTSGRCNRHALTVSPVAPVFVGGGLPGWLCPKCGGGNSPYSMRCPCVPLAAVPVTFGFSVSFSEHYAPIPRPPAVILTGEQHQQFLGNGTRRLDA